MENTTTRSEGKSVTPGSISLLLECFSLLPLYFVFLVSFPSTILLKIRVCHCLVWFYCFLVGRRVAFSKFMCLFLSAKGLPSLCASAGSSSRQGDVGEAGGQSLGFTAILRALFAMFDDVFLLRSLQCAFSLCLAQELISRT